MIEPEELEQMLSHHGPYSVERTDRYMRNECWYISGGKCTVRWKPKSDRPTIFSSHRSVLCSADSSLRNVARIVLLLASRSKRDEGQGDLFQAKGDQK